MKRFFYTFVVGGLGGAFFLLFLIELFYQSNFWGLAILSRGWRPAKTMVREVKKEIITVSADEQFPTAIKKAQDSIVAIKTFKGGSLIRFGSGLTVTRDGLILTANQVVPPPPSPESPYLYQVFIEDRIIIGQVIYRDPKRNLALLRVSGLDLKPVLFSAEGVEAGANLLILGKLISVKTAEIFVQKVFINRLIAKDLIELDGRYENFLSGMGLINARGEFNGLVYIDGQKIIGLQPGFLEDFINQYLK